MNTTSKKNIIDNQTLEKLKSLESKTLESVVCYLWVNQLNPKETIHLIDAVEFIFSDGDKITLSGNEHQEGLEMIHYNLEEQKVILKKEFDNKIQVFKVVANTTEMWNTVINQKLTKVILTKDKISNEYLSDEIILNFENNEMRVIRVHPLDGIILDYYEEI
jgi:hypothetical protein